MDIRGHREVKHPKIRFRNDERNKPEVLNSFGFGQGTKAATCTSGTCQNRINMFKDVNYAARDKRGRSS